MKKRFRVVLEEVYGPIDDEASEVLASYELGGIGGWKINDELMESLEEELAKVKAWEE